MTVGGWIIFGCIAFCIAGCAIAVGVNIDNLAARILSAFLGTLLIALALSGMLWYYGNTQSGKRAIKTQKSNFDAGLERTVKVFDMQGDLIQEYSGRFDVDYNSDRIIFDDENGKRHIIYYPTGIVIIDER